jgi:hypothetical protein
MGHRHCASYVWAHRGTDLGETTVLSHRAGGEESSCRYCLFVHGRHSHENSGQADTLAATNKCYQQSSIE